MQWVTHVWPTPAAQVCGLLVGILLGSDFQPYQPQDTKLTLMMALIMAILVTLSAVNSLQLFGYERVRARPSLRRRDNPSINSCNVSSRRSPSGSVLVF